MYGNAETKMPDMNMLDLSATASKHVLASISDVFMLPFVIVFCL